MGSAELHIGYGIGLPNSAGSVSRLALQPYGHTGGPWKFITRDANTLACLDIVYGSATSGITINAAGYVGIGTTAAGSSAPGTWKLQVAGDIYQGDLSIWVPGDTLTYYPLVLGRSSSYQEFDFELIHGVHEDFSGSGSSYFRAAGTSPGWGGSITTYSYRIVQNAFGFAKYGINDWSIDPYNDKIVVYVLGGRTWHLRSHTGGMYLVGVYSSAASFNYGSATFTTSGPYTSTGGSLYTSAAMQFNVGSVTISGALSKSSGSFKIDHPLPSMAETHYLVHSFVEGPRADNIYRGKVHLIDGRAEVNIDEASNLTEGTFAALNREVQCFTSNESNWDAVRGSVSGNILLIESQNSSSDALISWLVIGERKDKHMYETDWTDQQGKVITEPLKSAIPATYPEPTSETP